jgi:hypothetical protein
MTTATYFCIDNLGGEAPVPDAVKGVEHTVHTVAEGIYDVSGRKTETLKSGINIVRQSDGTVRKVVVK